jgi:hypothetical protein
MTALFLSLSTMHRADGNAGIPCDPTHAHASRQQWRNFGPSGIFVLCERVSLCSANAANRMLSMLMSNYTAKECAFRKAEITRQK